ncbi:MAG TPA: hypothetical protein VGG13_04055 [Candidatus Saccharimonadales bacterium]|jgi:general secretion pathway protein G
MKKLTQRGVTIIELLVLLVIIGILAGLIIATRAGIDQNQNNTERQRDIGELRDELEAYYAQYNKYPTLANVNDAAWRNINMKGLNKQVLRDPDSNSYVLAAKPAKNSYAYTVTGPSGGICDDAKIACTQYTLTATLQGGGTYVKNNLN